MGTATEPDVKLLTGHELPRIEFDDGVSSSSRLEVASNWSYHHRFPVQYEDGDEIVTISIRREKPDSEPAEPARRPYQLD